jgi:DNA replicative helicase MCM subunit Mcm2 (Cdc46/Mcm family)
MAFSIKIECEDCGSEREIRPQDAHQVKKCKKCQKRYRLARRNELREICKDKEK